ncbi:hypothetical protein ACM01_04905 [Streptomyces viridochromogenes]|uniref:Uncharacterized protein n=1 Tax=Streptomyces viridochromogenes TaxID=1938 RepID=A0A0J7ZMC2_STRVR|nr:hypothetical protein ACM01_04905 [Streptomyces viridochromogenes]KOG23304.1 hypothetical protein ADK35_13560 [Streptomyces viridochromogenes]KOG27091.1 hypothetical protein ADK36_00510 [Streptomyces viridochromogenes]
MAAYAAEGVVWSRLAALLPAAEDVDEVQGCWDIAEQEAGLDLLVGRLVELGLPVGESARTEIAVMAEQWGEWDRLGAAIVACPGEDAQPVSLRVFEDGDEEAPVPLDVLGERADPEQVLVPWIACVACGRVLARVHRRQEWGDLSYTAESYVVFAQDGSIEPLLFPGEDDGSGWSALEALRRACLCG